MSFFFRRPFARLNEGIEPFAIVSYAKTPYRRVSSEHHGEEFLIEQTFFEYRLMIDLWFVVVRLKYRQRVP